MKFPKEHTCFHPDVLENLHQLKGNLPHWATYNSYAGRPVCEHIRAYQLKNILGEKIWNDYFSFGFVRNPYSRYVSLFHWHRKKGRKKWLIYRDFSDFLKACGDNEFVHLQNQQSEYLTNENGKVIVDFVGKFEDLQQDFYQVCKNIGIKNIDLPHINRTDHKDPLSYYNDKEKELVYNLNKKDFEIFGYEK